MTQNEFSFVMKTDVTNLEGEATSKHTIEDMTAYETDEYGQPLLPAIDVDKYFAKIFGTNISLAHGTFSDT